MKRTSRLLRFVIVTLLWTVMAQAQNTTFIPADDAHIVYTGRVSFRNPLSPAFTYPGVQVMTCFTGTSLGVKLKPHSGYFTVEVDGGKPFKVTSPHNDSVLTLVQNLPDGKHTATIMLAYEGRDYHPEFRGFYVDNGKSLLPLPALPERKIEFIGNSMTCGYGIEAKGPESPFSYKEENFYYTYAARTARALGAQHLVVAKSGIGIYRNYGDPVEGSPATCLPALYNQTQYMDSTEMWDFARYTPDVVCINLGTNDVSSAYDKGRLQKAYVDFLRDIRGHYPQAKIVLLSGVMVTGKPLADMKEIMNRAVAELSAQGERQVYRFDMTPQDGTLGYGTGWHPSLKQHEKMAGELTDFLQAITGWDRVRPTGE